MDRIAKALAEHDEVFAQINDALFGGGADELIHKLSTEEKKYQKRQAQVGLASNVLGIGSAVAALGTAGSGLKDLKGKQVGDEYGTRQVKPRTKKWAAAALGLQAANLGGDLVANRVLNREAKKKVSKRLVPISKAGPDQADLHVPGGYQLKRKKLDKVKKVDVEHLDVVWEGEISKVDEDKRQVFGFASVVEVNGEPVVDKQGDYISIDEVERSAYEYVQKSRKGGDMHRRHEQDESQPHHVSDMIESFVITDEKIEKMGLPEDTPRGWWVGFKVHDEDTWSKVKSGERAGFSIHGRGNRVSKVL